MNPTTFSIDIPSVEQEIVTEQGLEHGMGDMLPVGLVGKVVKTEYVNNGILILVQFEEERQTTAENQAAIRQYVHDYGTDIYGFDPMGEFHHNSMDWAGLMDFHHCCRYVNY